MMMDSEEIYNGISEKKIVPIKNLEKDNYFCDATGNIFSLNNGGAKQIQATPGHFNYNYVILKYRGQFKRFPVANLICETFNGARPSEDSIAIHIDNDHLNDFSENLRWGTIGDIQYEKIHEETTSDTEDDNKEEDTIVISKDKLIDILRPFATFNFPSTLKISSRGDIVILSNPGQISESRMSVNDFLGARKLYEEVVNSYDD
jgi:hypothetical protein